MKIELKKGFVITEAMHQYYDFMSPFDVTTEASTAKELKDILLSMDLGCHGDDYKEYNEMYACMLYELILSVGGTINSFSDGGKYWHVDFSYNGTSDYIGYDMESK